MSDLRKIAEDAVAGIGPDAEDVIDAARDDTAQAVTAEREAIAGMLESRAAERIDAAEGMSYMNARFLLGAAGALTHTAQAIRSGEHVKP